MKRIFLLIIYILGVAANVVAQGDSIKLKKPSFFKRAANGLYHFFSPELDTMYIEPQKFNFTAMVQTELKFDHLLLENGNDYSFDLAPKAKVGLGPYFGWRWLFLGYSFNINAFTLSKHKVDINTTVYTPAVGFDVVYRNLGNDYQIRSMKINNTDRTNIVKGLSADGLNINVFSITAYYILNSKRYSHQAAFNQSNCQKVNAGSWIVGTGYTANSVEVNWDVFNKGLAQKTNNNKLVQLTDSNLLFKKISYKSIPFTVGYGYNWVLAKNCLLAGQMTGSLSYMWSNGDVDDDPKRFSKIIEDFKFRNFTFDGMVKLGFVWNTSRWFAGADAIYHTYHYHQDNLKLYNIFGTVNFYVGFNFWRRKR